MPHLTDGLATTRRKFSRKPAARSPRRPWRAAPRSPPRAPPRRSSRSRSPTGSTASRAWRSSRPATSAGRPRPAPRSCIPTSSGRTSRCGATAAACLKATPSGCATSSPTAAAEACALLPRPAALPAGRAGQEASRLARPSRRLQRRRETGAGREQPRHARRLQQRPVGRLPHRRVRRTDRRLRPRRLLLRRQLSPSALFLSRLQDRLQARPQTRPAGQDRSRRRGLPRISGVARPKAGGPLPPDAAGDQEGERRRGADLVDGERGAVWALPLFAAGDADAAESPLRPADAGMVAGRDELRRQPGPVVRRRLPEGDDRRPAVRLRAVPDVARQPLRHGQLPGPRTADARAALVDLRRRAGDVVRLARPRGRRRRRLPRGPKAGKRPEEHGAAAVGRAAGERADAAVLRLQGHCGGAGFRTSSAPSAPRRRSICR